MSMDTRKRCLSEGESDLSIDPQGALVSFIDTGLPFKLVQRKGKKSKTDKSQSINNLTTQSQPASSMDAMQLACPTDHCEHLEKCVYCDNACLTIDSIQCKLCQHFYHLSCFGVDPITFPPTFANLLGWSCEACRLDSKLTIQNLRTELNHVQSTLDTILIKLSLSGDASGLASATGASNQILNPNVPPVTHRTYASVLSNSLPPAATSRTNRSSPGPNSVSQTDQIITRSLLTTVVLGTIRDVDRRRTNVVISGLPESRRAADDVKSVSDLLSTHVRCPSIPEIVSCVRLGKSTNQTHNRKVLVRFNSEKDATTVLNYAKTLRISTDRSIADNVYINADLSKEEAKLAYDKRVTRRNTAKGNITVMGVGGVTGNLATTGNNVAELRATAVVFKPSPSISIPVVSSCRSSGAPTDASQVPSRSTSSEVLINVPTVNSSASPAFASDVDSTLRALKINSM